MLVRFLAVAVCLLFRSIATGDHVGSCRRCWWDYKDVCYSGQCTYPKLNGNTPLFTAINFGYTTTVRNGSVFPAVKPDHVPQDEWDSALGVKGYASGSFIAMNVHADLYDDNSNRNWHDQPDPTAFREGMYMWAKELRDLCTTSGQDDMLFSSSMISHALLANTDVGNHHPGTVITGHTNQDGGGPIMTSWEYRNHTPNIATDGYYSYVTNKFTKLSNAKANIVDPRLYQPQQLANNPDTARDYHTGAPLHYVSTTADDTGYWFMIQQTSAGNPFFNGPGTRAQVGPDTIMSAIVPQTGSYRAIFAINGTADNIQHMLRLDMHSDKVVFWGARHTIFTSDYCPLLGSHDDKRTAWYCNPENDNSYPVIGYTARPIQGANLHALGGVMGGNDYACPYGNGCEEMVTGDDNQFLLGRCAPWWSTTYAEGRSVSSRYVMGLETCEYRLEEYSGTPHWEPDRAIPSFRVLWCNLPITGEDTDYNGPGSAEWFTNYWCARSVVDRKLGVPFNPGCMGDVVSDDVYGQLCCAGTPQDDNTFFNCGLNFPSMVCRCSQGRGGTLCNSMVPHGGAWDPDTATSCPDEEEYDVCMGRGKCVVKQGGVGVYCVCRPGWWGGGSASDPPGVSNLTMLDHYARLLFTDCTYQDTYSVPSEHTDWFYKYPRLHQCMLWKGELNATAWTVAKGGSVDIDGNLFVAQPVSTIGPDALFNGFTTSPVFPYDCGNYSNRALDNQRTVYDGPVFGGFWCNECPKCDWTRTQNCTDLYPERTHLAPNAEHPDAAVYCECYEGFGGQTCDELVCPITTLAEAQRFYDTSPAGMSDQSSGGDMSHKYDTSACMHISGHGTCLETGRVEYITRPLREGGDAVLFKDVPHLTDTAYGHKLHIIDAEHNYTGMCKCAEGYGGVNGSCSVEICPIASNGTAGYPCGVGGTCQEICDDSGPNMTVILPMQHSGFWMADYIGFEEITRVYPQEFPSKYYMVAFDRLSVCEQMLALYAHPAMKGMGTNARCESLDTPAYVYNTDGEFDRATGGWTTPYHMPCVGMVAFSPVHPDFCRFVPLIDLGQRALGYCASGECVCKPGWTKHPSTGLCDARTCPTNPENGLECNGLQKYGTSESVCNRDLQNPTCECWKALPTPEFGAFNVEDGLHYISGPIEACEVPYSDYCVNPSPTNNDTCTNVGNTKTSLGCYIGGCSHAGADDWSHCKADVDRNTAVPGCHCREDNGVYGDYCELSRCGGTGGSAAPCSAMIEGERRKTGECVTVNVTNNTWGCSCWSPEYIQNLYGLSSTVAYFGEHCEIPAINCTDPVNKLLCGGPSHRASVPGDRGTCALNSTSGLYQCTCKEGFNGTYCENTVRCSGLCPVSRGSCVGDDPLTAVCRCYENYAGEYCHIDWCTLTGGNVTGPNTCNCPVGSAQYDPDLHASPVAAYKGCRKLCPRSPFVNSTVECGGYFIEQVLDPATGQSVGKHRTRCSQFVRANDTTTSPTCDPTLCTKVAPNPNTGQTEYGTNTPLDVSWKLDPSGSGACRPTCAYCYQTSVSPVVCDKDRCGSSTCPYKKDDECSEDACPSSGTLHNHHTYDTTVSPPRCVCEPKWLYKDIDGPCLANNTVCEPFGLPPLEAGTSTYSEPCRCSFPYKAQVDPNLPLFGHCVSDCGDHGSPNLANRTCDCIPGGVFFGTRCERNLCPAGWATPNVVMETGSGAAVSCSSCSCEVPQYTGVFCNESLCEQGTARAPPSLGCDCYTGWSGTFCNISGGCSGRGEPSNASSNAVCVCDAGWSGETCGTNNCLTGLQTGSYSSKALQITPVPVACSDTFSGLPDCLDPAYTYNCNCEPPAASGAISRFANGTCKNGTGGVHPIETCSVHGSAVLYSPNNTLLCKCNRGWTGLACSEHACQGDDEAYTSRHRVVESRGADGLMYWGCACNTPVYYNESANCTYVNCSVLFPAHASAQFVHHNVNSTHCGCQNESHEIDVHFPEGNSTSHWKCRAKCSHPGTSNISNDTHCNCREGFMGLRCEVELVSGISFGAAIPWWTWLILTLGIVGIAVVVTLYLGGYMCKKCYPHDTPAEIVARKEALWNFLTCHKHAAPPTHLVHAGAGAGAVNDADFADETVRLIRRHSHNH